LKKNGGKKSGKKKLGKKSLKKSGGEKSKQAVVEVASELLFGLVLKCPWNMELIVTSYQLPVTVTVTVNQK